MCWDQGGAVGTGVTTGSALSTAGVSPRLQAHREGGNHPSLLLFPPLGAALGASLAGGFFAENEHLLPVLPRLLLRWVTPGVTGVSLVWGQSLSTLGLSQSPPVLLGGNLCSREIPRVARSVSSHHIPVFGSRSWGGRSWTFQQKCPQTCVYTSPNNNEK